jgi:predicted TPR repeat methyltransferase
MRPINNLVHVVSTPSNVITPPIDYDAVAAKYDKRWETSRYDGVLAALQRFIGGTGEHGSQDIAEIGCGTGHWLAALRDRARRLAGVDLSAEMLKRARPNPPAKMRLRTTIPHRRSLA